MTELLRDVALLYQKNHGCDENAADGGCTLCAMIDAALGEEGDLKSQLGAARGAILEALGLERAGLFSLGAYSMSAAGAEHRAESYALREAIHDKLRHALMEGTVSAALGAQGPQEQAERPGTRPGAAPDTEAAGLGTPPEVPVRKSPGSYGPEMRPTEVANPSPLACADCRLPYGEDDWADFVVPNHTWAKIVEADDAGVLCFNCMNRRAVKLGISCEGKITSGPFVDRDTLHWTEAQARKFADDQPAPQGPQGGEGGRFCAVAVHALAMHRSGQYSESWALSMLVDAHAGKPVLLPDGDDQPGAGETEPVVVLPLTDEDRERMARGGRVPWPELAKRLDLDQPGAARREETK